MENSKWKNLVTKEINKMGGLEYLLACNYDFNLLRHSNKVNCFIRELIEIHAEIAHGEKRPKVRASLTFIKNQIINNNKHILSGGKSLFIKQLVDANLDQIDDWVNAQGRFYSYNAMQTLGANISPMQYNQILSAIPKEWKQQITNSNRYINQPLPDSDNGDYSQGMNRIEIKEMLLSRKFEQASGIQKWELYLGRQQGTLFWSKAFTAARKVSTESKLQMLQYKILHRILPTKKYLFQRNTADTPNCIACRQEETIEHMLFECPATKKLWNELTYLFQQKEQTKIKPSITTCIIVTTYKEETM